MKRLSFLLLGIAIASIAIFSSCTGSSNQSAVHNDSVAVANGADEREVWRSGVYELQSGETLDFDRNDHPVVVDFNAVWCGPCQRFKPTFDAMAQKYDGKIEFISVDVERCPETAAAFNVQGIPHILFVTTDGTISSHVGFMEEAQFDEALQKLLQ